MSNSKKPKIGISVGDINGVGLEVVIKTLQNPNILTKCTPIIYGSQQLLATYATTCKLPQLSYTTITSVDEVVDSKINILTCWDEDVVLNIGESNTTGGKYALLSLQKAVDDLKTFKIDGLVTAPINKDNIQADGFNFPGHTEFLADAANSNNYLMFLVNQDIKVGTVTGHIPINQISDAITKEAILNKLEVMNTSLINDFGIAKPKIAVLGLNPHAGDNGLLGSEEIEIIEPTIKQANKNGIHAIGPLPADGFFGSNQYKNVDAILSMYHDQGLIPFKALSFGKGVNFTAGLPFIRTSPDHGTAYSIAGKNQANESSFKEAILSVMEIHSNR